jgi:hypothetical protein
MLREGARLALSDFAKVAAHSALLKARVESKWHRVAGSPHQTIPSVRERDSLFKSRTVSLCVPMKSSLRFWNYTRRFGVNVKSHEVPCRSLRCAFSRLPQCLADA